MSSRASRGHCPRTKHRNVALRACVQPVLTRAHLQLSDVWPRKDNFINSTTLESPMDVLGGCGRRFCSHATAMFGISIASCTSIGSNELHEMAFSVS